jgi:hypothetical protein
VTVPVFCSGRDGIGHPHDVSRFEPSRHRVDIDGAAYWVPEIITTGDAVRQACAGTLKKVAG